MHFNLKIVYTHMPFIVRKQFAIVFFLGFRYTHTYLEQMCIWIIDYTPEVASDSSDPSALVAIQVHPSRDISLLYAFKKCKIKFYAVLNYLLHSL